jgi:hypothetical protein
MIKVKHFKMIVRYKVALRSTMSHRHVRHRDKAQQILYLALVEVCGQFILYTLRVYGNELLIWGKMGYRPALKCIQPHVYWLLGAPVFVNRNVPTPVDMLVVGQIVLLFTGV